MNNLNLPENIRRKVKEYFMETNSTSTLQNELNDFMTKRISQTYRILCSIQIFKDTVKINPATRHLFKSGKNCTNYNNEVINNLVKRMETKLKSPEENFFN